MRLYYIISGSGEFREVAQVSSFEEATKIILALDERCQEWVAGNIPTPAEDDPLRYWEGCDVYLDDAQDVTHFYDDVWNVL